jgi:hypothetical protein
MTEPINETENRVETVTAPIRPAISGLRSSVYCHVDFDRPSQRILAIRLSEKSKDGFGLDPLFTALGDELTSILKDIYA